MSDYAGLAEGEEYKPCSARWIAKNKTEVNFCPAMEFHLAPLANEGRGFVVFVLTDLSPESMRAKDGPHTFVAGVNYRMSGKDTGLLINHCPWCGNDLGLMKVPVEERTCKELT